MGLKLGVWVWSKVLSRLISRGTLNSQEIERIYYQTAVQGICTLELHIAILNCSMHYARTYEYMDRTLILPNT